MMKEELVFTTTEEIDITIPVVSGIGETIDLPDVSLSEICAEIDPAFTEAIYNEKLLGKTYKLKITLTGKNPPRILPISSSNRINANDHPRPLPSSDRCLGFNLGIGSTEWNN